MPNPKAWEVEHIFYESILGAGLRGVRLVLLRQELSREWLHPRISFSHSSVSFWNKTFQYNLYHHTECHHLAMTKISTEIDAFTRELNNKNSGYKIYFTRSIQFVGLARTHGLPRVSVSSTPQDLRHVRNIWVWTYKEPGCI